MADPLPTFYPVLRYRDAAAAIEWLCGAFGFSKLMVVPGETEGSIGHAELAFGTGVIMLGTGQGTAAPDVRFNAPYVFVEDPDAHFARAKAAEAVTTREPNDTDYGSREYSARDPEGNEWSFGTYRPAPAAE